MKSNFLKKAREKNQVKVTRHVPSPQTLTPKIVVHSPHRVTRSTRYSNNSNNSKSSTRYSQKQNTPPKPRVSLMDRVKGPSPAALARRAAAVTIKPTPKPTTPKPTSKNQIKSTSNSISSNSATKSKSTSKPKQSPKQKTSSQPQFPGSSNVDSVRDLQERLLMAQTQILQWLFVTAKLERATTKQTATGQRQLYAVWRATEQAGQAVASLELLLTAAKASQQCKRSLLHESQALRLLGIAPSVSEERNQMEQEHANKRHALESKTHTSHAEFKAFAEALSSSLSWMSVTGEVSATDSSQNGNLDLAMEQLSRTTTILEAALFNELKSVTLLSNEWETLADTTESVTSILSSSDVKSVHDLNAFKTKNNSLDLLKRPGTTGTTGTGTSSLLNNVFNRTSRAISGV